MTRLIIDVSARNGEGLRAILPEKDGWYFESEEYEKDCYGISIGTIIAQNDQEDNLSVVTEQALNTNPEVICYYLLEEYYEQEEVCGK